MRAFRVFVMLLTLGCAAAAEAKSYSADRFDSRVEVLQGGALRITETVVFRFEGGPYKEVFRHLRTRDTDGVDVVSASMDGVEFPRGEQPGTVQVSGDSRVRITWRFAPVADSTHTFELTYVMHGVVHRQGAADVLRWTAIPVDHKYRIASSTISIDLPASPVAEPEVDSRRVNGQTHVEINDARLRINATELRSDGWIRVTARMPQGSVIATLPAWQEKLRRQSASAPMWMTAGGVVLAAGLILLFSVRQGYEPPPRDRTTPAGGPALPDTLAPAEAGAVIANGTPGMAHAMATLFALAERGELTINEEAQRAWGQRHFTVLRRSAHRPVATYEQVVLDVIFTDKDQAQDSVPLDKARSRLTRHFKRFRRALENELNAHRLLDADRAAVRHRFGVVSVVSLLIAGCVALPLAILALDTYGGWPLMIPAALAILAFVSLICHASHTKLSNEGVRRARYWRGFRDYLKDVAHDRTSVPPSGIDRLVPYAVALGIADGWARFLKKHKRPVPSWFNAAAADDSAPAFVAFVAYSGVTAGGGAGGHGGAGGAGGGASGAG